MHSENVWFRWDCPACWEEFWTKARLWIISIVLGLLALGGLYHLATMEEPEPARIERGKE